MPRDVAEIFGRPPPRPRSSDVPIALEARRSMDLADRVLQSVRKALGRPHPPREEDAEAWRAPVVEADYDDRGRLRIQCGWATPGGLIAADRATPESLSEGGFGQDADGVWHILEPVPEHLRSSFKAGAPRIVEGDAIPAALADLRAEPLFRPSARVAATRVHEAPALSRCDLRGDAPGWLHLDARYVTGPHELTLAQVLRAAGAEYLRVGDDFIPLPRGALVDEARAGYDGASDAIRLPALAYYRATAREVPHGGSQLPPCPPLGPAPLPTGYTGALRPHQRAALDWLWSLRRAGLGGILADEMGLGKTHMTLALVCACVEAGARAPSLVVAPTSVVPAWAEKVRAFAPGLDVVEYAGGGRCALLAKLGPRSVLLATYGVLVRDIARIAELRFEVAVLDEAHRIKNPETGTARAARKIAAEMRLAVTGTPIENRTGEIRALLDFAVPGYLPRDAALDDDVDQLRRFVRPFKLRRRKCDVLTDLPEKREETRWCDLSDDQAALYREVLAEARATVKRGGGLLPILAAITRLKRVCDHAALVLPDGRGAALRSGKLDDCLAVLDAALAAGRKVVIFTQYLEMMDILEDRLRARGVEHADLRGATRDRAGAIRRFQDDPACRVMVVSLLAGGVGIDLTSATLVIHYDRWWNSAREDQATDRVHRIGQSRAVEVVRLVTRGTLEERIDRIIAGKARLLDEVVAADEAGAARTLDRTELEALLQEA